jgi:phenylpropionate dioxygenase-like ring-hydroxylating dioxygenase large terminal subunit
MNESVCGSVRALPGTYYTNPEHFSRVRDRLFYRSWQFACHVSRIPQPGDYVAFSICDQDLFVVRGENGEVSCFFNVCQHRGHPLLEDSGHARAIVCPYHGWSYELSGQLRGAPGTRNLPTFDRSAICLTPIKVEIFHGFVFVNLDPEAAPMNVVYPGVHEAVAAFCPDIEARVFAHAHDALEHANWLAAIENYNECYHCQRVHKRFASGVIDPRTYDIRPFGNGKCLQHTAKAQSGAGAWYDTSGSDYASFFLWPTFSLQLYPSGMVNTYHWRPLGVDRTRVFRSWYSPNGLVDDDLRTVIDLDRDTTFAEDLEILNRVQRGMGSLGYRPGNLVLNPAGGIESEHSIAKLHEWVREVVDD